MVDISVLIDNRYEIIKEISRESYLASLIVKDLKESTVVSLQRMINQKKDAESRLRFKKEVEILKNIDHPNIVKILGCGEHDGKDYLVTELFEGTPLKTAPDPLETITKIVKTVDFVHEKGIIHRNLNPRNILIKNEEIKINGFCLSRIISLADILDEETIIETFSYMSPEQAGLIQCSPDERSDLYSLGIIFFELITGKKPYEGKDINTLLHQHIAKLPPKPKDLNPKVSDILQDIILKLINKMPEDRYQTAKGLLSDLAMLKQFQVDKKLRENFRLGGKRPDRQIKLSHKIYRQRRESGGSKRRFPVGP